MTDVLAGQVLRFQWNNYASSWGPAVRDLRRCGLFHDVTLVTSDNQLVTAHRIVLAACSSFFRGVLSSLPLQSTSPLQPAVLYMRGVTGPALLKLLDFMYNGEVYVEPGLLKEFLNVGEDLRYRVGQLACVSKSLNLALLHRVEGLCEKGGQGQVENVSVKKEPATSSQEEPVNHLSEAPKSRGRSRSKPVRKLDKTEKKKRKREGKSKEFVAVRNEVKETSKSLSNNIIAPSAPGASTAATSTNSLNSEHDLVKTDTKLEILEIESSEENECWNGKDDKDRRTPTPRKKARKTLVDLKDEAINRDVLTMDPGEAHGILKLVENLDTIEEESEDLNVYIRLLNQLILKSDLASNVLYFCGICQKSLKSKPHMLNHIEASHVAGVFQKCSECGTKFKTRSSLSSHKLKAHKIQKKEVLDGKVECDDKSEDKIDGDTNLHLQESVGQSFDVTNNISASDDNSSEMECE